LLAQNGIASASVEYRLYRFGSDGLSEGSPRFPDYLLDCARAAAWVRENGPSYHAVSEYYLSGTSAGGYISMMLLLDRHYLAAHGLAPWNFSGYLLDDGQPTVHYNILRERGMDNRLVRVDEAAPVYWADDSLTRWPSYPKISILYAEKDIVNRAEQNELLYRTLLHFGYPVDRLRIRCVKGYGHSGYCGTPEVFAPMFEELLEWK
jgi:acetyl esterase/lipase